MGFDLHEHRSDAPCSPACIARKGGRGAQFAAQMSLLSDRSEGGFFAQKSIDGQPTVNGSPLIMGQRSSRFMYRQFQRQTYYESIGVPKEVQRQLLRTFQERELGVPRWRLDQILIVVEAFQSWYDAPAGAVTLPGRDDPSIGLHCVHLTHYADYGEILGFWNNWGPWWGDRGHGTLPFEYLEKYFHEAFVTRRARFRPPAWNFVSWPDPMPPREFRRRLLLDAPRERRRLRRAKGENWVIEVYETASPTTGYLVLCVDVLNGFGLRMGWAFLRSRPIDEGIMEIPELFVWPTFRRMGVGRLLEEIAQEYAAAWECREIHLMINEADAVLGPPACRRKNVWSGAGIYVAVAG